MTLAVVTQQAIHVRHAQKRSGNIGRLLVHNVLRRAAGYHAERKEVDLTVGLIEIIVAFWPRSAPMPSGC